MKMANRAITAIGSLLTLGSAVWSTPAPAADKTDNLEKCFGVVKAGKNDCAGPTHDCAGQSKRDGDGKDFINVPKGTCERLSGGSPVPK
jgi:uncharacterized membrane protein